MAVDRGGSRFVYSAMPQSSVSVVGATHNRARRNGQDFDIGLIIGLITNGATVNQVLGALTAGKPQSVIVVPPGEVLENLARLSPADLMIDVGLLDVYDRVDVNNDGSPDPRGRRIPPRASAQAIRTASSSTRSSASKEEPGMPGGAGCRPRPSGGGPTNANENDPGCRRRGARPEPRLGTSIC